MNEIKIFLTPEDAEMFKSWQQFHAAFALMIKTGVFDIKNGSVTIHFGNTGEISSIKRNDTLYDVRIT